MKKHNSTIDLSQYSISPIKNKEEWRILLRYHNHIVFIINIHTHFIVGIKEYQCKKMQIQEHIENRLLMEYIRSSHSNVSDCIPHMLDTSQLYKIAENHWLEIQQRKNTYSSRDSDEYYFDVGMPLEYLMSDLENLRIQFGLVDFTMRELEFSNVKDSDLNIEDPNIDDLLNGFDTPPDMPVSVTVDVDTVTVDTVPVVLPPTPVDTTPLPASPSISEKWTAVENRIKDVKTRIGKLKNNYLEFTYGLKLLNEQIKMLDSIVYRKKT